jgi:hypothetical protein
MLSMPRIVRPDPLRNRKTEFGSPAGSTTRPSILAKQRTIGNFEMVRRPRQGGAVQHRRIERKLVQIPGHDLGERA